MIDLDTDLQGHLEVHYQACTEAAICEAKIVCEEDYHGNCAQFLSSFISPVCDLFQKLKKVKCVLVEVLLNTAIRLKSFSPAYFQFLFTMTQISMYTCRCLGLDIFNVGFGILCKLKLQSK